MSFVRFFLRDFVAAVAVAVVVPMTGSALAQGAGDQAEVMREEVPAAVVASAVEAVSDLGHEVVQGRYQVALERMNPKWKHRYAMRNGGMKQLEERLELVASEMVRSGVTMVSCRPQGKPTAYGVSPAWRILGEGTGATRRYVATQWLVLVPTTTQFRIFQAQQDGGPAKRIQIESIGYQVAVSGRDTLDWTFIDGAGLTVNDLRSLFVTLPQDLELPPVEKREIR